MEMAMNTTMYEDRPMMESKPTLVQVAQDYVQTCDTYERLQSEMRKLNEEMKQVDIARKELREKLLHMINEPDIGTAAVKARSW